MDELKDDLQSKIADYSKMAESGKNEKQFFSFFPYFYMHRLANEPKPSRPVYILFHMMHLCQGLHSAAKIYQQIWVAIFAKKRLKEREGKLRKEKKEREINQSQLLTVV